HPPPLPAPSARVHCLTRFAEKFGRPARAPNLVRPMTALQIVKGDAALDAAADSQGALPRAVDLVVDGMHLTARVPDADLLALLRDLAWTTADLRSLRSLRRSVRCFGAEGPWEIGLERDAGRLLVSIYRGGPFPEVAIFERSVDLGAFTEAL